MTLRYPQMTLPIQASELNGKILRVEVAGAAAFNLTLTAAASYRCDRTNSSSDAIKLLAAALTAQDPLGGATYTVEWDKGLDGSVVPGYYWIRRDPEKSFTFYWAHANTTLNPTLFGFAAATYTSTNVDLAVGSDYDYLPSAYQAGRLWVPQRIASRPVFKSSPWAETLRRPDGYQRVHVYDDGPELLDLSLPAVPALFCLQDMASRADYLSARRGAALGDPNLSLQALLLPLPSSGLVGHNERGPLRYCPDRTDPSTYYEVELREAEDRRSLEGVLTNERLAPHRFDVMLRLQKAVSL